MLELFLTLWSGCSPTGPGEREGLGGGRGEGLAAGLGLGLGCGNGGVCKGTVVIHKKDTI